RLRVHTRQGSRSERVAGSPSYDYQLRAFVAAVRNGTAIPTGPADAIANMRVIDAMYDAARRGFSQGRCLRPQGAPGAGAAPRAHVPGRVAEMEHVAGITAHSRSRRPAPRDAPHSASPLRPRPPRRNGMAM